MSEAALKHDRATGTIGLAQCCRALETENQRLHAEIERLRAAADQPLDPAAWTDLLVKTAEARDNAQLRRLKAEIAALQIIEQRYTSIVENVPDILYAGTPEHGVTYLSPSFYEYSGAEPGTALGHEWLDYFHPDDKLAVTVSWEAAMRAGLSLGTEYRLRRHDGEYEWFRGGGRAVRNQRGDVVEWFGASHNIQATKLLQQRLEASETRLRLAIEGTGMGTWDADLRSGQAFWSDNAFTSLGYTPSPNGKAATIMWLDRVHPDDLSQVLEAIRRSVVGRGSFRERYRIIRADNGEVRSLLSCGSCTHLPDGTPDRFTGVFFDVTECDAGRALVQMSGRPT